MYLINKDETEHTGQVSLISLNTVLSLLLSTSCVMPFEFLSCLGVVCVEDVPGALLGLFPCWRLFQKAI